MQIALFDIDGTLYPGHSELTHRLDRLITEFVAEHLSLSVDEADRVRR
ncbi:MAG: pyrimidine 5'-nucleotidase, partial [Armatimonadia bacterium]|nr:pyrimidine 5'-nucleotidase [Armatimonadia bacterium]